MNKKILLLLFTIFVISVMLISCKKFDTTATNVSNTGDYTSIDPILGQDYQLTVKLEANAIQIGISSGGNPVGDSEIIDFTILLRSINSCYLSCSCSNIYINNI